MVAGDTGTWLRKRVHNLLRAVGEGYSQLGDFAEDENKYELASLDSLAAQIDGVLTTLTEREARAVRLRFGLEDGQPRTLNEAGKVMGVTGERVRQLEAVALRRLREPARRTLLPPALN